LEYLTPETPGPQVVDTETLIRTAQVKLARHPGN